uniref:Predicted protein n=1 Tax=Hordeum vulgare subsp. vulgare TaxID=112509 RepID=F2DUK3_HORVV|nr:predicted protein [Hordeum vulgare subsp. vulgare]
MPTHSGLEERRLGLEEEGRLVVERRRWAWRSSLPPWTPAGVGSGIRRWSRTESRRRWTESKLCRGWMAAGCRRWAANAGIVSRAMESHVAGRSRRAVDE